MKKKAGDYRDRALKLPPGRASVCPWCDTRQKAERERKALWSAWGRTTHQLKVHPWCREERDRLLAAKLEEKERKEQERPARISRRR